MSPLARRSRSDRRRRPAHIRLVATLVAAVLTLAACSNAIGGTGTVGLAPNAQLQVEGDSNNAFDTNAKNALSDIIAFWKENYPKVSGGESLPPITGGLFSIDGAQVVESGSIDGPGSDEGCLKDDPTAIVDNAFYCEVDDSIVWDRSEDHLLAAIGQQVPDNAGNLLIAMAFAHEFGHAIQSRLKIFDKKLPTIDTESQADCAAGAWVATVLKNQDPHYTATPQQLDDALTAYLLVRDKTPVSSDDISHGDGFDRLSSIADGINHGASFCYSPSYFDRSFTERPFTSDQDYLAGGNECFAQVVNASTTVGSGCSGGGGLQPSLNTFWQNAAKTVSKTFTPVKIAEADHPKCAADSATEFGYCPDDNTVYYSTTFAKSAYYSLQSLQVSRGTAAVKVLNNQAADFALGELFSIAWGFAVRHQIFNQPIDDGTALLAAACYSGAYAKSINSADLKGFALSPPDLDEATYAMMQLVPKDQAFGARDTTGLQRIQSFVKGYNGGLSVC